MKLRNKKTGEVREGRVEVIFQNNDKFPNPLERHAVESFAELNEEWEDYEPAEPLIKDEKTRKAVRAWAEANKIEENNCYSTKTLEFNRAEHRLQWIDVSIEFNEPECLENLENGRKYTIDELCGEGEE